MPAPYRSVFLGRMPSDFLVNTDLDLVTNYFRKLLTSRSDITYRWAEMAVLSSNKILSIECFFRDI